MSCVSSVVVGFLLPMCMCIAFGLGCTLVWWLGTADRRKNKAAQEELGREKDAFKDREIQTHAQAVAKYHSEAEKWREEAESLRAASEKYKQILDANGITYRRQTMFPGNVDLDGDTLKGHRRGSSQAHYDDRGMAE